MASPAEIANDMAAHATYWAKRDKVIERACRDAARFIRSELAGERIDGRSWVGLHRRLLKFEAAARAPFTKGYPDFTRARLALEQLRRGCRP